MRRASRRERARNLGMVVLALLLVPFVEAKSAQSDEPTVRFTMQGMEISNLFGSLLWEGGVVRYEQYDSRRLMRWNTPMRAFLAAPEASGDGRDIQQVIAETAAFIEKADGPDISSVQKLGESNLLLVVADGAEDKDTLFGVNASKVLDRWPDLLPALKAIKTMSCTLRIELNPQSQITAAVIAIRPNLAPETMTACVRKTLGQAIGLIGEPDAGTAQSMFSLDPSKNVPTSADAGAIKLLYGPGLQTGMVYRDVFRKAFKLGQQTAQDMFPADALEWHELPASWFVNFEL